MQPLLHVVNRRPVSPNPRFAEMACEERGREGKREGGREEGKERVGGGGGAQRREQKHA
jgi:hypothetical protein